MNGETRSPTTGMCIDSSTSRVVWKSRIRSSTEARGSFGVIAKVTVSATSAASARAFGPVTAIATRVRGCWPSGAPSRSRSAMTVWRTNSSRSPGDGTGSPRSRSSSSMPGRPAPMPISKRPWVSKVRECASHAVSHGARNGEA